VSRAPEPMLASPAGHLPTLDGWTIEPKWDGIRVIAEVGAARARLWSRNGIDKSSQFPEVSTALLALAAKQGPMVLDGELVAIDAAGKPLRFQALQARGKTATRSAFVVFDCLAARDQVLVALPWTARRKVLESLVGKSARNLVRRGDSFPCGSAGAGRVFESARTEGWEGLILKRMDAPYQPGRRSPMWRKVKLEHEQEFVIGGYTLPTNGADRDHLGALLVGYYDDDGKLRYAGKVGTGYTRATLAMLARKLRPIERAQSPFADAPRRREETIWVKPVLVAQVRYNEMTDAGILRQPSFLGLRDDKAARDVRLEMETSSGAILDTLRCAS
jgi:bifunctional non-homologous end joining protein LigD